MRAGFPTACLGWDPESAALEKLANRNRNATNHAQAKRLRFIRSSIAILIVLNVQSRLVSAYRAAHVELLERSPSLRLVGHTGSSPE